MVAATELKKCTFLEGFKESELSDLAAIASHSQWKEGEVLFQAGSPASSLYILRSGTVLLAFPNGRSLPLRGGGLAIGWSSMVSPFKNTATALCLTEVTLYQFLGRELYRLIQMNADFGQRLMLKIAQIMEERRPYRSAEA